MKNSRIGLSENETNNLQEIVTKKANNKIEDIFIDLDNDGVNDLSHAKNLDKSINFSEKKASNTTNDNDDSIIIKL